MMDEVRFGIISLLKEKAQISNPTIGWWILKSELATDSRGRILSHPYESLERNPKGRQVTYSRKDGLNLSAVIYTPVGYDRRKTVRFSFNVRLYPRRIINQEVALQVRGSKYGLYSSELGGSPIYWRYSWLLQLWNQTEMPIVGEVQEPNDYFLSNS